MRLQITVELEDDDERVDLEHPTGLTTDGYEDLTRTMVGLGFDDIEFEKI